VWYVIVGLTRMKRGWLGIVGLMRRERGIGGEVEGYSVVGMMRKKRDEVCIVKLMRQERGMGGYMLKKSEACSGGGGEEADWATTCRTYAMVHEEELGISGREERPQERKDRNGDRSRSGEEKDRTNEESYRHPRGEEPRDNGREGRQREIRDSGSGRERWASTPRPTSRLCCMVECL
jgi:hypothetical protein